MMKKIFFGVITFLLVVIPVKAENLITSPDKIDISVSNIPLTTKINNNLNSNGYYTEVSPLYEFYDEYDIYNIVYVGKDSLVHWIRLNSNNSIIFNKNIEMSAPYFGNAIYNNGYLYIIYGRGDIDKDNTKDTKSIEVTKYDRNGNVIKNLALAGEDTTISYGNGSYGTWIPFSYANYGNCSLAIKDNILIAYFGRLMYNSHQSSFFLAIDIDDMTRKSNGIWPYFSVENYASHSFDQRVIVTKDNNILTLDLGDAGPRGIRLSKTEFVGIDSSYLHSYVPFHFREGVDSTWGYNNVYSIMGNIIEVNDGYIYVGASEKTLSLEYSTNSYNESWNLYVQKYKLNLEEYTTPLDINMLNVSDRTVTGIKPVQNYGKLFLSSNTVDYGVKWLTNYDEEYLTDIVRTVKIDNDKVLILYEIVPAITRQNSYTTADVNNSRVYYMIIDKDANIVQNPVLVENVTLSKEIDYLYKDGYVLWTSTDGVINKVTLNKLKIGNVSDIGDVAISKIELYGNDRIVAGNGKTDLNVLYYPWNTNDKRSVTFKSSNPSVASVDDKGSVIGLTPGVVTITASTKNGVSDNMEIYSNGINLNKESLSLKKDESFKLVPEVYYYGLQENVTVNWNSSDSSVISVDSFGNVKAVGIGSAEITCSYSNLNKKIKVSVHGDYILGDVNKDGNISLTDVIKLLKYYLSIEKLDSDVEVIGDMNSDGSITLTDVIKLLKIYLSM